ncbi:unnamed protein product [Amoebophrya sp. A120]|nr:unnamed protein product [Amoebophrya sp. A120]|eukprot:GSA120T00004628001.1
MKMRTTRLLTTRIFFTGTCLFTDSSRARVGKKPRSCGHAGEQLASTSSLDEVVVPGEQDFSYTSRAAAELQQGQTFAEDAAMKPGGRGQILVDVDALAQTSATQGSVAKLDSWAVPDEKSGVDVDAGERSAASFTQKHVDLRSWLPTYWGSIRKLQVTLKVGQYLACKCSIASADESATSWIYNQPIRITGAPPLSRPASPFLGKMYYVPWNSPLSIRARLASAPQFPLDYTLGTTHLRGDDDTYVGTATLRANRFGFQQPEDADGSLLGPDDLFNENSAEATGSTPEVLFPVSAEDQDLAVAQPNGKLTGRRGRWASKSNADPFLLKFTPNLDVPASEYSEMRVNRWSHARDRSLPDSVEALVLHMPEFFKRNCEQTCYAYFHDDVNALPEEQANQAEEDPRASSKDRMVRTILAVLPEVVRYTENEDKAAAPGSVVKLGFSSDVEKSGV